VGRERGKKALPAHLNALLSPAAVLSGAQESDRRRMQQKGGKQSVYSLSSLGRAISNHGEADSLLHQSSEAHL
jgi:hypothetical protein